MPLDRASALRAVISFNLPIDAALRDLHSYGWDSDLQLATLTTDDLRGVLERYVAGALTAEEVTLWAGLVEIREDISFEEADGDRLKAIIFQLATPEINERITPKMVQAILDGLQTDSGAV